RVSADSAARAGAPRRAGQPLVSQSVRFFQASVPVRKLKMPPSDRVGTCGQLRSWRRYKPCSLREAFFDFYVDAEGAVVVAQGDDGDIAADVVLDLDNLLLRGADVADVGNGEVASDLLLDGDASGG